MSWRILPDLALRTRGGDVVLADDETFGEKENLIKPDAPAFQPHMFGHRPDHGRVGDSAPPRTRRKLGDRPARCPRHCARGRCRHGLVTGNYPPQVSVEAAWVDPLDPSVGPAGLIGPPTEWAEIVPRSPVRGDSKNGFDVDHDWLVSHVRLRQYPDGGIARLRVQGEPVGDPRWVAGRSFDLAAMEHGAGVLDCSNWIYSAPDNLLVPGPARVMGEGWETSRRRDEGNDWVMIRLATAAVVRQLEIDTSFSVGNAPGEVSEWAFGAERTALLARTPVQPDAVNRFILPLAAPVNQLRVDIFPDGGLARFRAWGEPSSDGRTELFLR